MARARNAKGRFVKRRRAARRHNPAPRRRRRRARPAAVHHYRRRRNPSMRRRVARRRTYRRRRHNPAFMRGIPFPNLMDVGIGVAGAIAAKQLTGMLLKDQLAKDTSGYLRPAATLGGAVVIGMILNMLKQGSLAKAAVMGGAIVAGLDIATKVAPQLVGSYTVPSGMVPVLNGVGGVGYPDGFHSPTLGYGDDNNPTGFEWAP